jgi:hypothetical protein
VNHDLGRRVDGRRLAAMVELEDEAVVAALDLRWLSSSATFSTFTAGCHRGAHPGLGRVRRRHPDRVIPDCDLRRRLVGCERSCARR